MKRARPALTRARVADVADSIRQGHVHALRHNPPGDPWAATGRNACMVAWLGCELRELVRHLAGNEAAELVRQALEYKPDEPAATVPPPPPGGRDVYATARNTASVRRGYEMGGYVKAAGPADPAPAAEPLTPACMGRTTPDHPPTTRKAHP